MSIGTFITMLNTRMPTKWSYNNLITCGSNIRKVTLITPSQADFFLFMYYTFAELYRIISCIFRSACQREKRHWPGVLGASRINNGYYVLTFENIDCCVLPSTTLHIVELIVLTGQSGLWNRLIWSILYLLEQLLDQYIW
jgi:hypothetical protein